MCHFFHFRSCKIILYKLTLPKRERNKKMDDKKGKIKRGREDFASTFGAEQLKIELDEFVSAQGVPSDEPNEPESEKTGWGKLLLKSAVGIMWAIIALLLGLAELPFGAVPFGFALLCAASSKLAYIYAGLGLSSIFAGRGALVYLCAYTITLLVRVLCRVIIDTPFFADDNQDTDEPNTLGEITPLLFSENIKLRMSCSALGSFIIGIYTLISGGFLYYDLFGAIIGVAVAPLSVYLFCGLAAKGGAIGIPKSALSDANDMSDMRKFSAICALLFAIVLATKNLDFFGASLSLFVAMFATLYFCRHGGIMYGIVTGTVVGLAYSPMLAPMFAFAAISSGALFGVSVFFACLSAATVAMAWGLYSSGMSALTSILPAMLSSCLIFAVIEKLYLAERFNEKEPEEVPVTEPVPEEEAEPLEQEAEVEKQKCELLGEEELSPLILLSAEERLSTIQESFSSLSSLFYKLSEKTRTPSCADLRQLCDNVFDSACHACKSRAKCWESEYTSSLASVSRLCASLSKNGRVTTADVSPRMLERCPTMPDIINNINRSSASYTEQLIVGDKTEIFAIDYEATSSLLAATAAAQKDEFRYRRELSERACKIIDEGEFAAKGVLIYGNARKRTALVWFENEEELYTNQNDITDAFEELLGEKLTYNVDKQNPNLLVLSSARRFSVEYAKKSLEAKGEESFCGDTVSIWKNVRDNFYSFISDGMGSGREAALTSNLCSVFLSKMLPATARCTLSLAMLNDFLRNQGGTSMRECSATVDLLEFDYLTGKAEFYKGGAAPSYIYRDGNLLKLRSNTVPLGIIKELDIKKTTIDTADGDIIIMVSDGVTQSKDECPWLLELLRATVKNEELSSIADMIVNEARARGADDDISVVVMKISSI